MAEFDATPVKAALVEAGQEVEAFLGQALKGRHIPCELLTAMEYSLMAGGKRLRPVLCLTTSALFGLDQHDVMPFASALEFIHTYSLIHDDLPAMDDDDLRRGKPSNHKKFGEARAILAGDGLLTEAFTLMASVAGTIPAERIAPAIGEVAVAAGAAGMVGGQDLDMAYTGRDNVSLEDLRYMHSLKTGALITVSCVSGALLAGASPEEVERIRAYGKAIGAAFQIVDDILDEIGDEATLGKPVGSDQEQGKVTYPSLLGLDTSRELASKEVDTALEQLAPFSGPHADFLRGLAQYIIHRAW
ncbi:MAG: polyprenyl synthetase family protein [Desulfovibrio sp.]|nr:MAG: polyprenyl synthetase family protein [Desulfovibrio sp.]